MYRFFQYAITIFTCRFAQKKPYFHVFGDYIKSEINEIGKEDIEPMAAGACNWIIYGKSTLQINLDHVSSIYTESLYLQRRCQSIIGL